MSWKMIDVSSNNHPDDKTIDWAAVLHAGYSGVMIKCTEGVNYVNPWMDRDAHGARVVGLHVGYYHFARPIVGDAASQAQYALEAIKDLPRDLGLALDLEEQGDLTAAELSTWGETFVTKVAERKIGSPVYLNPAFLALMPKAPWGHHLWLADWGKTPRRSCWAWQRGQAEVAGVSGMCDVGVFYG